MPFSFRYTTIESKYPIDRYPAGRPIPATPPAPAPIWPPKNQCAIRMSLALNGADAVLYQSLVATTRRLSAPGLRAVTIAGNRVQCHTRARELASALSSVVTPLTTPSAQANELQARLERENLKGIIYFENASDDGGDHIDLYRKLNQGTPPRSVPIPGYHWYPPPPRGWLIATRVMFWALL